MSQYDKWKELNHSIEEIEKNMFDIRNSTRRKVVCIDNEYNPWGSCDNASLYLKVGNQYTVKEVDVHSCHTKVSLEELPGLWFNSVSFNEIQTSEKRTEEKTDERLM